MRIHPLTLQFDDHFLEQSFLSDYGRASLMQVRVALTLAIVIYSLMGLIDLQYPEPTRTVLWTIRYAGILPIMVSVLVLTFFRACRRYMEIALGVGITAVTINVALVPVVLPSFQVNQLGIVILMMYAFTAVRLRFIPATLTGLGIFLSYNILDVGFGKTAIAPLIEFNLYLFAAFCIGMLTSYQIEKYLRQDYLHDRLLREEQEKAESLLLNILPAPVAARLKSGDQVIAESFSDVTILFADLVNFTEISSQIAPEDLVRLLNEIFSEFDRLAERHGLEKIKTIGDAYMVVGGLPIPRPDHAEAVAEMALEMQAKISQIGSCQQLSIRIGINTGPVVAGVIGIKKFIYDLWGDTVNVASRMESHGLPDTIHVTEQTYQALSHKYVFKSRGLVSVKGKGEMPTYLLVDRKPLAS
jgi:class 3 adenylate cyclase